jgi:hypothetical protein
MNFLERLREWIRDLTSEWKIHDGVSFWIIVAIIVGTLYTCFAPPPLVWGLAAFGSGILLGFVFGIPRVEQTSEPPAADGNRSNYRQRVNTNLEEISDWLTKIIVGVGLVELGAIPRLFQSLVEYLATPQYPANIVGAVIIFFLVTGFMSGYLSTRIFLASAFSEADQAANRVLKNVEKLKESLPETSTPSVAAQNMEAGSQLASVAPQAAILNTWRDLYLAGRAAILRESPNTVVPKLANSIIRRLSERGIITKEQADTFRKLKNIRDDAADARSENISSTTAVDYVRIAEPLVQHLMSYRPEQPHAESR